MNYIKAFSAGCWDSPVLVNGPYVANYFSVVRPGVLNSVRSSDTSSTRVSAGAKPMVLGSTCGAATETVVASTVDGVSKDSFSELNIVGYYCGSQMVRNAFHDVEDLLFLRSGVFGHKLEGTKQLGGQKFTRFLGAEVLKWHKDCCGSPAAVNCGDRVVLERDTSEKNLGAV